MDRISANQKRLLLTLIEENLEYVNGRFQSAQGSQFTYSVWERIHRELNAIGPSKTISQWKKCWKDLRLGVKAKATKMRQYRTATGGGEPSNLEFTEQDNRIMAMIGVEGFDGLPDIPEGGLNMTTPPLHTSSISTISFGPEDFQDDEIPIVPSTSAGIHSIPTTIAATFYTLSRAQIHSASTPMDTFTPHETSTPSDTSRPNRQSVSTTNATNQHSQMQRPVSSSASPIQNNNLNTQSRRNPYLGTAVDRSMENQLQTIDLLKKILSTLETIVEKIDHHHQRINQNYIR